MILGRSSRRLLVASGVFGLFVLLTIGLFAFLIFRSLSQREVERILIETRHEAEGLAEQIARRAEEAGEDLYTAIILERETRTYIDAVLRQRDIVQTVEVRDRDGILVFQGRAEARVPETPGEMQLLEPRELPPQVETETLETEATFEVSAPIGDLGLVHIGISRNEMERRIELLRAELIRQTSLVGATTVLLLGLAYLGVWGLLRRERRLEQQAAEAERMAYIGTLASGLAHEIRNPLNSLNLNIQLLEEDLRAGRRPQSGAPLLRLTREEISRLERLVTDFLSYAKPRPPERRRVRAADLFERVIEVTEGQLRRSGVRVEVAPGADGVELEVDPGQMGQLLLNLTQNALAAVEGVPRAPAIRFRARREEGRVVLEVSDNGVGIPREARQKIFEVFYSTRKGGSGLGLAVVERIARAHGGEAQIDSTPGQGTTVRILLPAPRGRELPSPQRRPAPPVATPRS